MVYLRVVSGEWRVANGTANLFSIRYSLFAIRLLGCLGSQLLALFDGLFDGADHVEGGFRQMIIFAFDDSAETLDGVGKVDEFAGRSREDFGDVERLRQEALDLAGAGDRDLVFFRQ